VIASQRLGVDAKPPDLLQCRNDSETRAGPTDAKAWAQPSAGTGKNQRRKRK